ncbi:MAG: DoxX family membrane protein [Chloroflexota bacterium]
MRSKNEMVRNWKPRSSIVSSIMDRGAAFWLAVAATAIIIALYLGDVARSLRREVLADGWQGMLGISISDITLETALTWAFWLAVIALVVVLFQQRSEPGATEVETEVETEGPAFVRFLFRNSRAGLLWLPIRVFLGIALIDAGLHKLLGHIDENWQNGTALAGFWSRIADAPEQATPAIPYDWHHGFIKFLVDGGHEGWFSWLIILGEIAVGVALLLGFLTGIAAFFGVLMNGTFLLAGSESTNPALLTLAIGVILAWRVAGYYGVDRHLLPKLATLWKPDSGSLMGLPGGGQPMS